jgi:hypothetical protein
VLSTEYQVLGTPYSMPRRTDPQATEPYPALQPSVAITAPQLDHAHSGLTPKLTRRRELACHQKQPFFGGRVERLVSTLVFQTLERANDTLVKFAIQGHGGV